MRRTLVVLGILFLAGLIVAQPASPHTVYGNVQRYEGTIPPEACLHMQFTFGVNTYDEADPEFTYDELTGTFFLQITDDLFSVGDSIYIDAGDSCMFEEQVYVDAFAFGPETYIGTIYLDPIEGLRPELLAGYMDPTTGYVTDVFEFGVTYLSNPWGRAPNYVRLWIDDTDWWNMSWAGTGTPHYELGEPYTVSIDGYDIGKGDHYYYFYAEDSYGLPVWTDPVVFTILNSVPTAPAIHLEPELAFDDEDINVFIDTPGDDEDDDPLSYYYEWYRGGVLEAGYSGLGMNSLPFSATIIGEVWEVRVYSYDGEAYSPYASDVATIIAPILTDGEVAPTAGDRSTLFTYTVTYTNARNIAPEGVYVIIDGGDPIEMTEERDYSDGVEFSYSTTLGLGEHTYRFQADDVLGHTAVGDTGEHTGPTVGNNLPSITNAVLFADPDPATERSTITAVPAGWYDADGDPEGYHYVWYINDSPIGYTGATIDGDYFDRGDVVYCEVFPYDGYDEGDGIATSTMTIQNSLPDAPVAGYAPIPVYDNDDIVISITTAAYDPDGDPLTYHYSWSIGGYSVGHDDATLDASETEPGDLVNVEVWANDTYGDGVIYSMGIPVNWPTLSGGTVIPVSGLPTEIFRYEVTYTSARDIPPHIIYVIIDGDDFAMTPTDPGDMVYTDGYGYYLETTLPYGDHTYAFIGNDIQGNEALGEEDPRPGPVQENTPPEVTEIEVTPYPDATETDTIRAVPTGYDADSDPFTFGYQWYNAAGPIPGATASSIRGNYFDKGDIVRVEVWANDGWENGESAFSDYVTIINTLPTISDVDLIADPAGWFNELGELVAVVDANDVDDDDIFYTYVWYVNGVPVVPGPAVDDRLDGAYFDRGDTVYFEVTVSDDEGEGETDISDEVVIGNAPPVFEYMFLSPENPTTTSRLEVNVVVNDPDGDDVDLTYEWFVDGDTVAGWFNDYVPASFTEKHETWQAVVTAEDEFGGVSQATDSKTILNTPPIVGEVEETLVVYGVDYYTTIRAFDPDADHIVWHLVEGPEHLVLDTLTGDLSWTDFTDDDSLAVHSVAIIVTDDETEVPVAFNLHVYPFSHEIFAPSNLDALSGYLLSIPMSWDAPVFFGAADILPLTFVEYEIQRSTDLVTWSPLATSAGTGYVDALVTGGTLYYYRVRASYMEGPSSWSNIDFATPGTINSDMLYSAYTYMPLPELDGVIEAGEWTDATEFGIGGQKLFIKNTENMLFIAFIDAEDDQLNVDDAFYVQIEDSHNLRWPGDEGSIEGEYRVTVVDDTTADATFQGIWGVYPGAIGRDTRGFYDEVDGAAGGGYGEPVVYEMAIAINPDTDYPAAINSNIGNVVGFRFASYDAGMLTWTNEWLTGSQATDPESFGNLMLGVGAGGPKFSVWRRSYEVWLLEGLTTDRPMWVSNLGNGSIDYELYESYLPFRDRDEDHPVLLYTDEQTIGEDALTFLGYSYDLVNTSAAFLTAISSEDYEAVVVTRLEALTVAELATLEAYVVDGGKVIINCPDLETTGTHTFWTTLGMDIFGDLGLYGSAITWENDAHPIFNTPLGVPPSVETVEGTFDDYGDAVLSTGATILATFDDLPYPANGAIALSSDANVILNSFVMSDSRDSDFDDMIDGVELLVNEIYYLIALEDIPWLDVDLESGTLASHETHDAVVTFDATYLTEGDYLGYIMATSDDPVTPLIPVPCMLHVRAPTYHLVRIEFPDELLMFSPGESFELPITATGIEDAGIYELSMTIQTNSTVVSPVNVTSDYDVVVTGYDLDYITFELTNDIVMEDGEVCMVEFEMNDMAPVAAFSNLDIGSIGYNDDAYVGTVDDVDGRVMVEAGEMDWAIELEFTHGSLSDVIYIGVNPEGTDLYDVGLDMLNDPPGEWFDPFSDVSDLDPGNPQLDGDIRSPYDDLITWYIPVGDSAGKLEWSFRDEDTLFAMGSLFLNGDIDMKTSSVYFFDPAETLIITYRRTGESPFVVNLYPGWNMVSLPIIPSGIEATPANVYPGAEYVYYYDPATGLWAEATAIEPGVGYVLLSTSEQHYTLWGQPLDSYTYELIRGWDLIGSIYRDVNFSAPTTSPPGAVMGSPDHAYYYDVLSATYISSDELEPGKGYFVASNLDATLSIPGISGRKACAVTKDYSVALNVDIAGETTSLVLGAASADWVAPIPPTIDGSAPSAYLSVDCWKAGEAYFVDGVTCDLIVSDGAIVTISDLPEGLSATVEVGGRTLTLEESIELPTAGTYKVVVGDLPRKFALHPNIPNPFNPTTTISFELPERCDVNLEIYDLLGNKVITLANEELTAGEHRITWDGEDSYGRTAPSGVYFYRIKAGENSATRRMLLLK